MAALTEIRQGFLPDPTDLSELTHIDAAKVRQFVTELNAVTPAILGPRKLVAAIATGGTIAMKVEDKIRVPDLDFNGVLQLADPKLPEQFHFVTLDVFGIDSSQMDYSHIRDLAIVASYTWAHTKVPFLGFLVLHGTDTLSYASATFSLMMGQGLPFSVVYTAAQKPIQEPLSDAPANIQNALYTLEALHEKDMAEVAVVMGDRAVLATTSEKVDDTEINAFDAPLHQYVARFNRLEYPVRLAEWLKPHRPVPFEPTIWRGAFSHTLVVKSTLGLAPEMVARQVMDPQVQAVLLYSFGAGTFHEGITDAVIPAAASKNIPVFVISPVNTAFKTTYHSGMVMIQRGVVPLYMTLSSALAKIELALRKYPGDNAAIGQFMVENYVGEIPTAQSRYLPAK